ncbi:hypothetical protein ACOME3_002744 [Neoechinorhynchus agilis]
MNKPEDEEQSFLQRINKIVNDSIKDINEEVKGLSAYYKEKVENLVSSAKEEAERLSQVSKSAFENLKMHQAANDLGLDKTADIKDEESVKGFEAKLPEKNS